MLVAHQERPRELKWYHAGPMLYGDWGTSRFYVLGLAFFYALYASFHYVVAVGILVAAVGWAYTVICKAYPDGGGVYSAARQISPSLGVIGALLLFADYAVTAALSAFDGMRYMGAKSHWPVALGAIGVCILLGVINYVGPKKAGTLALLVAGATLICTLILTGFSIPHLAEGWANIQSPPPTQGWSSRWVVFTSVVLALSGVEAVANMTGIMVQPVARTAKKSIWPVLLEVVLFNIILAIAMLALHPPVSTDFQHPAANYSAADDQIKAYKGSHQDFETTGAPEFEKFRASVGAHSSDFEEDVKDRVLRVMGDQYVAPWFGAVSGAVFGLLLFSAVNTVIGGMISVCYVMSRDRELPPFFTKLNLFGVPWAGLIPAIAIPVVLLLIFSDIEELADLYAIGVVGAIGINLTSCTINRKLAIKSWERAGLGVVAVVMIAIEATLAFQKLHAVIFVSLILGLGMGMRLITKMIAARRSKGKITPSRAPTHGAEIKPEIPAPAIEEPAATPVFGTPARELDMSKRKVMVATRGSPRLMEFAANYAHQINGSMYVIYVRQLNVQFAGADTKGPSLEEDADAQAAFKMAEEACKKAGVQLIPIYVVSPEVAMSILDFAATYAVDALLMGVSRKGSLLRALQGDVLTEVADHLPNEIPLLIHA